MQPPINPLKSEGKCLLILISYLLIIGLLARQLPIQNWADELQNTGFIFISLYWFIFIIRGFFLFPPLYFLLALMVIYNLWETVWIFLFGIFLSATVSFLIGYKSQDHSFFNHITSKADKSPLLKKMKSHGYKSVFIINLLGLSFDIPNYIAGSFRLRYSLHIALVMLAELITTLFFTGILKPIHSWIL